MPMHRTLPDFVELNEQRFNFYEDPENEARLVEGLRFIKQIKPSYAEIIPNAFEIVQQHDFLARQKPAEKRVNIFQQELSDDDLSKPATPHLNARKVSFKAEHSMRGDINDLGSKPTAELLRRADSFINHRSKVANLTPGEPRQNDLNRRLSVLNSASHIISLQRRRTEDLKRR